MITPTLSLCDFFPKYFEDRHGGNQTHIGELLTDTEKSLLLGSPEFLQQPPIGECVQEADPCKYHERFTICRKVPENVLLSAMSFRLCRKICTQQLRTQQSDEDHIFTNQEQHHSLNSQPTQVYGSCSQGEVGDALCHSGSLYDHGLSRGLTELTYHTPSLRREEARSQGQENNAPVMPNPDAGYHLIWKNQPHHQRRAHELKQEPAEVQDEKLQCSRSLRDKGIERRRRPHLQQLADRGKTTQQKSQIAIRRRPQTTGDQQSAGKSTPGT